MHAANPAPLLVAIYTDILRRRMAGMPLVNPKLSVQTIGFHLRHQGWLGILATPWCMNLALLPAAGLDWPKMAPGEIRRVTLPGGDFDFVAGQVEGLGDLHACSLFSPMFDFADDTTVAEAARAALEAVLAEPTPEAEVPDANRRRFFSRLAGKGA